MIRSYVLQTRIHQEIAEDNQLLRGWTEGAITYSAARDGYAIVQGTVQFTVQKEKPDIFYTTIDEEAWNAGWRPVRVECQVADGKSHAQP